MYDRTIDTKTCQLSECGTTFETEIKSKKYCCTEHRIRDSLLRHREKYRQWALNAYYRKKQKKLDAMKQQ